MSEPTTCAPNCCESRLAALEKRVSRIRTGLLVALGVLLLLIGIQIGRGGERRAMRGPGAPVPMHAQPDRGMDGPMQGPRPMMGRPMRGERGPDQGPGRGPGGPRDDSSRRESAERPSRD